MEIPRDTRPDDTPWPPAQWPPTGPLTDGTVALSLVVPDDAPALFAAMDHDAVWAHVAGRPASAEAYAATLAAAPEQGRWPWVVRLARSIGDVAAGTVVGTTSYLDVSLTDARLEIGYTGYAPSVWGTAVNPACKLVLLQWAFEHGFGRVQMKTDIRNLRSQRAILSIGATYEGVLRRYQRRRDDTMRDTVMFSVVAEEWPAVREHLHQRLTSSQSP